MKIPATFRYTKDKVVPWNFTSQAVVQELQAATEQNQETSINDIAGTRGMIRSSRCYAPVNSGAKEGKESVEEGRVKITVPRRKGKKMINEPIIEAEGNEFLKFI